MSKISQDFLLKKIQQKSINQSKYYNFFTILFVLCLIIANVAEVKIINFLNLAPIGAGNVLFPVLYVINDIITEVYGFSASKKMILLALFFNMFFMLLMQVMIALPSSVDSEIAVAFNHIFSLSPRIFVASIISYFCGGLLNTAILAFLKIYFNGKIYAIRAMFSTLIASIFESALFGLIAFYGRMPNSDVINMICIITIIKMLYELACMPLIFYVTNYIKIKEQLDIYELPSYKKIFSPFL